MNLRSGHTVTFLFFLAIATAFLASCAQIVNPTGGPKDTEAPYDSVTSPANYTTNFTSNTIEVEFNEWIRLVDPTNQIVISPPLPIDPEFRLKKKTVIIDLMNNELLPNTTYTINFGEAVEDITESNKAKNLQYVFSTGTFIDSMMCFGQVTNAYDLSPVENAVVMLYAADEDSLPYLEKPRYFTTTDKTGNYVIRYIKEGSYKAVAIVDENTNYLYDLPTEGIGFMDSMITPGAGDSTLKPANMRLFFEDNQQQFIKDVDFAEPGKLQLIMKKMDSTVQVTPLNATEPFAYSRHHERGDSLTFWLKKERAVDTLLLEVRNDTAVLDTIEVNIKRKELTEKDKKKAKPIELMATTTGRNGFDLFRTLNFTFTHPIDSVVKDSIYVLKDSVLVPFEMAIAGEEHQRAELTIDWEPEGNYYVYLAPGAFTDIYGFQSDTVETIFKTQKEHYYGIFNLDVTLPDVGHGFVLQFYDEKKVLLDERMLTASDQLTFENLSPGLYSIKLIFDENGNGAWDSGDYLEGRQAEKIIFFSDEISIRSNWDLDLKWLVKEER